MTQPNEGPKPRISGDMLTGIAVFVAVITMMFLFWDIERRRIDADNSTEAIRRQERNQAYRELKYEMEMKK